MIDEKTGLEITDKIPDLQEQNPADTLPPVDRGDVTNLDEDYLRRYIFSAMVNCVSDKQDYGWLEKKEYAIKSYYGLKNEAMKHWPHENASAFPVPLTPTLMDTAWANVQAGLFTNHEFPITIPGVGIEDIRPANMLLKYQNWQLTKEIKIEQESDKNVLRAFLYGDGVYKVMFDLKTNKVKVRSIDIENFFVPIDATGVQRDETDIIIHVIPLSYNDVQLRKAMKIYRYPDAILPGTSLEMRNNQQLRLAMDQVSGMSMDTKVRRDNYYIAEVDLSYIPPDSFRPMDLKVWITPNGGVIQRIRKVDKSLKRPYSVVHCYPYADRFYSMGLPEKIRNEQEKLDYSDKQYTDSLDVASNPAMFVDDTDSFVRGRMQRVRGGIYPKGKGNTIDWEPQPPIDRGHALERQEIWEMAMKKAGIFDSTIGVQPERGEPLGTTKLRDMRADIRTSLIFKRFGQQLNEVVGIVYELNYMYTPRQKIMDVIGYSAEGYTMNELFPVKNGELVNHNFSFSGVLQSDKKAEEDRKLLFWDSQMTSPLVNQDAGNLFNISREMAEINGIRDFDKKVRRPKETKIIEVDEFIQRAISGDMSVQIRPGINTDDYIFELQLFQRGQMYKSLEQFQKQLIDDALRRAQQMWQAEYDIKMQKYALLNIKGIQQRQDAMAMQESPEQIGEEIPEEAE